MKQPSVETKIEDILSNNFDSTTFGGGFISATNEILALFSTQQAQMREKIEELADQGIPNDATLEDLVKASDVLNILGGKK
jgi:hypothetical protein